MSTDPVSSVSAASQTHTAAIVAAVQLKQQIQEVQRNIQVELDNKVDTALVKQAKLAVLQADLYNLQDQLFLTQVQKI